MNQIQTTELQTPETSLNEHHAALNPKADILRRRWWLILLIAIVAGGATYAVSKVPRIVPPQFSSSGNLAINVAGGNDPSALTTAENNFASQYAQEVTAQPVIMQASHALAAQDASGLSSAVSGGTVASQNIVQVRASGSSAGQAQRRAAAVVKALSAYIANSVTRRTNAYSKAVEAQLAPIDSQIRTISGQISAAPVSSLNTGRYLALQQTLSTLIAQRSSSIATAAQTATGGEPVLSLLNAPGPGSQTVPRPTLYAAVGFVLALILASQAVMFLTTPRRR
jgi:capsular polysaccharide biosynthesis protein